MIDASRNPRHNHLLDALPQDQWERWRLQLEYVDMPLAQVLYEPGNTLTHVYFPTTSMAAGQPPAARSSRARGALIG